MEDLRPEAVTPSRAGGFERRLYGVFREPLWFRIPLACLSLSLAFEILSAASEITSSRDWTFVAIAMIGLEPIGAFMALMTGALLLPRTFVLRWFDARKRAVGTLVATWFIVLGAVSLLVLCGVLH
jgi:hypothetical protein